MLHPIYSRDCIGPTTLGFCIKNYKIEKMEGLSFNVLEVTYREEKRDFVERYCDYVREKGMDLSAHEATAVITKLIRENGNILIDAKSIDWDSPVSRKTIEEMRISDLPLPYGAGAIALKDYNFLYNKFEDGFHFVSLGNGFLNYGIIPFSDKRTIGEFLKDGNFPFTRDADEKEIDGFFQMVSALMYVTTFRKEKNLMNIKRIKPKKKRDKKSRIPYAPTTLIELKQPEYSIENPQNTGKRKGPIERKTKAWLVKGHWRKQYYPSEGKHKLKWINPYWKGDPEFKDKFSKTIKL